MPIKVTVICTMYDTTNMVIQTRRRGEEFAASKNVEERIKLGDIAINITNVL